MKIKIKVKRFWFFHENSDSFVALTQKQYMDAFNTSEGYCLHELGEVIDGTKVEAKSLFIAYNAKHQIPF